MLKLNNRLWAVLLGTSLTLCSVTPAMADDSEIYVGAVSTVKPNILLLIDTSFSMDTKDATDDHPTFNADTSIGSYAKQVAGCDDDKKIFYTTGADATEPTCASINYISSDTGTYQYCDKLYQATKADQATAPAGRWTGKAAQYNATTKVWEDLHTGGDYGKIECFADRAVHGQVAGIYYARNGGTSAWTGTLANEINWTQRKTYTFYSARWVLWNSQTAGSYTMSRIQAVKNAVKDMVSSIDEVNIGVMRFNNGNGSAPSGSDAEYQGGYVATAIQDVTTSRNDIINKVDDFSTNSATPLSEMLFEAGLYWAGKTPLWGKGVGDGNAHVTSTDTKSDYLSPIKESCQRNFNILLTDGRPTWDNQNDADIESGTYYGAKCTGQPGEPNSGPDTGSPPDSRNAGRCLDEMSQYLARKGTDLSASLTGEQVVSTYTIGFGKNDCDTSTPPKCTFDFLTEVATDGGGKQFTANNVAGLNKALTEITSNITSVSSTFATASIGVNSFNRTSSRDDLYFAVFNSDDHLRWDGNLKKYRLFPFDPDGAGPLKPTKLIIAGQADNVDVIDSKGFFAKGSWSFWSPTADGEIVTDGGAVSQLPAAASRVVLTHVGNNPKGAVENLIKIDDTAVTDTMLDVNTGTTTRAQVIDFAKGVNKKRMGDPLHSAPAVVTYAGTATSPIDVVYSATNDGFLHAVDAATGKEKWAFVPQELLSRLKQLYLDPATTTRTYGLDGDIRILKLDYNGDGDVDTADGDLVWLFIGMRRGGRYYYALDVTNRDNPKMMWKIGPGEMADIGETWSAPTFARVKVNGAGQNAQNIVLVFGGGYDGSQENYVQVADAQGNNIWMVDAKTGSVLWSAGESSTALEPHNLAYAPMTNSIPGRVSVIDINGDGYADRMYAADTGGRVFRFDVFSGNNANALVYASVMAKLGRGAAIGGNDTTPANDPPNTRRFYNAPDVTLIQRRGADPYYNLAIGSGYRGHPLHKPALDRFYSIRDKLPYAKFNANDKVSTLVDTSFVDIPVGNPMSATVGPADAGWKLVFDPTGTATTATGEKVLNEATTVNGVILFSTYAPISASSTEPCRPTSQNRVYAVRVDNGHPALDLNGDGKVDNNDLFENVIHEGILGGVNVGVLRGNLADAMGSGTSTVCLAGMHILGKCVSVSDSVRTYWRKDADQP